MNDASRLLDGELTPSELTTLLERLKHDASLRDAARALERAIELPFARGEILTAEFGGRDGTDAVTQKVIAELRAQSK